MLIAKFRLLTASPLHAIRSTDYSAAFISRRSAVIGAFRSFHCSIDPVTSCSFRDSKWFEPRSISSSCCVIVWVSATNNSSFQNYTHPDDHTIRTTVPSDVRCCIVFLLSTGFPASAAKYASGKQTSAISEHAPRARLLSIWNGVHLPPRKATFSPQKNGMMLRKL